MNINLANKNIIGSDETGVGDYFTPLIVCAVFVPKQNVDYLIEMGVKDSKKLSDIQILKIYDLIKSKIKSSTMVMNQIQYNNLTNKKWNANELKMMLHMKAITTLEEKIDDVDFVIIDQFSNLNSIQKYREKIVSQKISNDFKNEVNYFEKGESVHVSVAAASILARTKLIELMKLQNAKYNFEFPLGANNIIGKAKEFVEKHGEKELYNVAKISFKTTKEVLNKGDN